MKKVAWRNSGVQEMQNSEFQEKQNFKKTKPEFQRSHQEVGANLGIKSRIFMSSPARSQSSCCTCSPEEQKNQVIYQRSFSESLREATTETHWTALEFFLHFLSQHCSFLASYCASSKVSSPFSPFQPLLWGSEAPYFSISACIDASSCHWHWETKQK